MKATRRQFIKSIGAIGAFPGMAMVMATATTPKDSKPLELEELYIDYIKRVMIRERVPARDFSEHFHALLRVGEGQLRVELRKADPLCLCRVGPMMVSLFTRASHGTSDPLCQWPGAYYKVCMVFRNTEARDRWEKRLKGWSRCVGSRMKGRQYKALRGIKDGR